MLSLNDVSAWVEVDGKELEQYGVEEDPNQSQVTCWIATQVDKCFSVALRDNAAYRDHSICSHLRLDGSTIRGYVLPSPTNFSNCVTDRTIVQKDQTLSETSSRPFMFAKLELTDEDEYLNQASTYLGEIRIHIYRIQNLGSRFFFEPVESVAGYSKVHERSKKAVTHCVSYGQEAKSVIRHSCNVIFLDGATPLATFIFKYRDCGLLQANGIIPKPPPVKKKAATFEEAVDLTIGDDIKPEPIGEEVEIIDNAIQKRTAGLQSTRLNLSRGTEARPAKRIKQEKESVPTGDVIDLT